MLKYGVKSLHLDDYHEILEEVDQLQWLTKEFRIKCPTARIDACDTIGHKHRMWEWARILHLFKKRLGYPFRRDIHVLDVGTAVSLIGPVLSYLGLNVQETDVDLAWQVERFKLKSWLNEQFFAGAFDWVQMGFGRLPELDKQYDVVMSISTIEHVETSLEKQAWKEMYDRMKPGGIIIVTMDCFAEAKKGYTYDAVRYTNYSMDTVKDRVDELKSYGLKVIGEEDYTWYGIHVDDGSFAWLSMEKPLV